jgi:hypothetical protein
MLITIDNYIKVLEPISSNMPPKVHEIYSLFKDTIPDYLAYPILIEENKEEINNHLNIMNRYYESTMNFIDTKFTIQTPSKLDIEKHYDSPIHFKQPESEVIHHPINLPEPKNLEGIFNMNGKTELKQNIVPTPLDQILNCESKPDPNIKSITLMTAKGVPLTKIDTINDISESYIKPLEVKKDHITDIFASKVNLSELDKLIVNQRTNQNNYTNSQIVKLVKCSLGLFHHRKKQLIKSGLLTNTEFKGNKRAGRPKKY